MQAALSRVVTVNGREQARRGAPRFRTELCVSQLVVISMRAHGRVYRARFITATRLADAVGMYVVARTRLPLSAVEAETDVLMLQRTGAKRTYHDYLLQVGLSISI